MELWQERGQGKEKMIRIDTAYCADDKTYFIGMIDNILYEMSKENRVSCLCFLPNENSTDIGAYRACVEYNGKVYCMPTKANNLYVFDKSNGDLSCIPLGMEKGPFVEQGWIINDSLWMLSRTRKSMIEIDTKNDCVMGEYYFGYDSDSVSLFAEFYEDKIYIPIVNRKVYYVFDIQSKKSSEISVPIGGKGVGTISCIDSELMVVSGLDNKIYNCQMTNNKIEAISLEGKDIFNEYKLDTYQLFQSAIKLGRKVVLSPYNTEYVLSDKLVVYDSDYQTIDAIDFRSKAKRRESGNQLFVWKIDSNSVGVLDSIVNEYYKVSVKTLEKNIQSVKGNREDNMMFWGKNKLPAFNSESELFTLDCFVEGIVKKKSLTA